MRKLDTFNQNLYEDLEIRQRAISNWKKLKIYLMLYRVCSNRTTEEVHPEYEEPFETKRPTCLERIAPYVIDPNNRYKVAFDIFLAGIYMLTYWLDPIILAFHFKPLEIPFVNSF